MDRFFCISVRFLDPFFHGKGDGDLPEWPPSPMRLFQAMLAGSRAGWRKLRWSMDDQSDLRGAFLWLERQPPPEIIAPQARKATVHTLFVPNNDSDKEINRQERLTSKVARPHRLVSQDELADERQTLHYLWAIPEEEWTTASQYAKPLSRESQHLMALGWGIDQVVGNGRVVTCEEASQLSGERWQPWPDTLHPLHRIACADRGFAGRSRCGVRIVLRTTGWAVCTIRRGNSDSSRWRVTSKQLNFPTVGMRVSNCPKEQRRFGKKIQSRFQP